MEGKAVPELESKQLAICILSAGEIKIDESTQKGGKWRVGKIEGREGWRKAEWVERKRNGHTKMEKSKLCT